MKFEGKVAVVTGGGRGIGKAVALALAQEGADVVVADKDEASAKQVAKEIRVRGRRALAIRMDVTQEAQVNATAQQTLDELGGIDILINCAGVFTYGSVAELSLEDWNLTIDVNLKGTLICCRAVLPHMISKKSGVIINFSSAAAASTGAYQSAYVVAKTGIEKLTQAMGEELKDSHIRVNAFRPGPPPIDTEMGRYAYFLKHDKEPDEQELARWSRPEDIAAVILYLASDDPRLISGKTISFPAIELFT
jgi:NAD(P)-dependent dehydrogenase (short-subunit alcohol dehydrogenase family)